MEKRTRQLVKTMETHAARDLAEHQKEEHKFAALLAKEEKKRGRGNSTDDQAAEAGCTGAFSKLINLLSKRQLRAVHGMDGQEGLQALPEHMSR